MQHEAGLAPLQRLRRAEQRRDADAARDQAIIPALPIDRKQRGRRRDIEPRALAKRPHVARAAARILGETDGDAKAGGRGLADQRVGTDIRTAVDAHADLDVASDRKGS
jgi:hypothetical protein